MASCHAEVGDSDPKMEPQSAFGQAMALDITNLQEKKFDASNILSHREHFGAKFNERFSLFAAKPFIEICLFQSKI